MIRANVTLCGAASLQVRGPYPIRAAGAARERGEGESRCELPAMSTLPAGGCLRGGYVCGSTDKLDEYSKYNPVGAEHIARTVFHSLGIDDLTAKDREGRPFQLMEEGRVLTELF